MPDLSPCQALLDRDPILYMDLTEPLRRGEARVIEICPTGVLTALMNYDREGHSYGFSLFTADQETGARLLDLLPPDPELLFIHEEFLLSEVERRFSLSVSPPFYQAAFLGKTPPPCPEHDYDIWPLSLSHLPLLLAHYEYGDEQYLRRLLERKTLFGAFDGDALLGFIGCHTEGSIGLLEVLPPYRRRGIARALQSYMIGRELSLGHIPFAQIFEDNEPSLALQRSLGMTLSSGWAWFASSD